MDLVAKPARLMSDTVVEANRKLSSQPFDHAVYTLRLSIWHCSRSQLGKPHSKSIYKISISKLLISLNSAPTWLYQTVILRTDSLRKVVSWSK